MAFIIDHIKLRKTLPMEKKPVLLKEYLTLRDDLSSCSSSGFKSFPRRQYCCNTVRFLLEADLKKYSKENHSYDAKRLLKRTRKSKTGSSSRTISALQRASEAVLNAVKLLPFPASSSRRKGHSPKRFSRKLFKRSFWRKADQEDHHGRGEIKRWKLFREYLQEKNQPSDQNPSNTNSYTTTDTSSIVITTRRVSTSRSSKSCAESEFTASVLRSWTSNSDRSGHDDTVSSQTNLPEKRNVSHMVGATGGEDSIHCTEDRANHEGKQQLSPVSVLDCPLDDEEEDDGSVFEHQLARVEGTKQKLMQKITRFERLAQMEPLELETRFAMAELEDEDKHESNQEQLQLSKTKTPSNISNLLSAMFVRERVLVVERGMEEFRTNMLKTEKPQEWIQACVKEMEETDNWVQFNVENGDVGSVLEVELFSSLVDDLLIDLFSL